MKPLKRRLKKIEGLARQKTKDYAPSIIICNGEEDREKKLKEYYEKYGEGAIDKRIILITPPERQDKNPVALII